MRPSERELLRLFAEGTERRLRVGDFTGTEFSLVGGGVLWVADCAPDWAVQRLLRQVSEEVRLGFGDRPSIFVETVGGEVDL